MVFLALDCTLPNNEQLLKIHCYYVTISQELKCRSIDIYHAVRVPRKFPCLNICTYVPGNVYKLADSTWTNVLTVLQVVITCLVGIRNLDRSILEILWETISSSSNMKFLRSYISTKIDA